VNPRLPRNLAVVLVALVAATSLRAEPVVRVELPAAAPRIGDPVAATLILTVPNAELAGEPRFPAWEKTWGAAEILEASAIERTPGEPNTTFRQVVTLAAFATGAVALPAQSIAVPGTRGTATVSTPAGLELRVRSVLPTTEEKIEPKPPAPPRALPIGDRFWWSLGIGLLACLAAAAVLWRRQRGGAVAAAAAAALTPFAELRAALAALAAADGEAIPAAHTRLSLAVRRYLGRALGFPAIESTTSEITRELRGRQAPAQATAQAIKLLRDCDGVKFAREPASAAALAERLAAAEAAASQLESHLQPPPLPAAGVTA
jgi:hypothetical protein